ncbi:M20/M25/M40 family metallo-hydrolase [Sphingomonas aliaeris]|uniref:M20/M25/M40 family metallo-hydrolase n=1 Tax=Sphingomonas aliaeris TaxID=2759526 RepID=A0A974NS70_9SPHN|nr:M20/M25/M40 family metallo-hydrolase [Sphingomonas aliaeris]QQV75966.1 M20/M25/M40 family metallo-hydrolase [Sphingomonas aliaeris]
MMWEWLAAAVAVASPLSPAVAQTPLFGESEQAAILDEYIQFLAIHNVAADTAGIRRNAEALVAMMARRGLRPQLLKGADPSVPPAVYGEWKVPGASRTLVLYAHYDGQAVTPEDWKSTRPFEPKLYSDRLDRGGKPVLDWKRARLDPDWRLYGRSASDDKAGIMAILAAVDRLRSEGKRPAFNLKLVFEGEEEAGSPHLAGIIGANRALLKSDGWIIFDGPANPSGAKQVVLGVRGVVGAEITVYGPSRPLHSGHYGNWAPNPAMDLAQLLASMKDRDGKVTIKGFYDGITPFTAKERKALAAIPNTDAKLKADLALGRSEGGGVPVAEAVQLPSLNIDGIRSADVGSRARNVIPSTATATLDMRLVAGNDYRRQFDRLVAHIRSFGFEVIDRDPTLAERAAHVRLAKVTTDGGYNAERTPLDHPLALDVIAAVKRVERDTVVLPSLGGSLPLYVLREVLGAPSVTVAVANADNNQHAEDENLRLGNLWDAIAIARSILSMERAK